MAKRKATDLTGDLGKLGFKPGGDAEAAAAVRARAQQPPQPATLQVAAVRAQERGMAIDWPGLATVGVVAAMVVLQCAALLWFWLRG